MLNAIDESNNNKNGILYNKRRAMTKKTVIKWAKHSADMEWHTKTSPIAN